MPLSQIRSAHDATGEVQQTRRHRKKGRGEHNTEARGVRRRGLLCASPREVYTARTLERGEDGERNSGAKGEGRWRPVDWGGRVGAGHTARTTRHAYEHHHTHRHAHAGVAHTHTETGTATRKRKEKEESNIDEIHASSLSKRERTWFGYTQEGQHGRHENKGKQLSRSRPLTRRHERVPRAWQGRRVVHADANDERGSALV